MYIALVSIINFVCVLLVLVVLAQNSKGGGLSGQFGGAGASQLMGVKRTGDLLEKLTWGFAIALVVLTLATHTILKNSDVAAPSRSVNQERAAQQAPAQQAPAAVAPSTSTPMPEAEVTTDAGQTVTPEKPAVATPGADVAKPQNDPLTEEAK